MKIYVYAICKNEEQFVNRWVNSMKEADGIFVLDTGSSDQTVSKLKELGVQVKSKVINPWRFDVARNLSLDLVPLDADLCVCTDLDEIFVKGWREKMERALTENVTCLRYNYVWSFTPSGKDGVSFFITKAHRRQGYKWVNPVHEVLEYGGEKEVFAEAFGVRLEHYPDHNKSRAQYLPLLELAVKENPFNDRNLHYLGREYMFCGRWLDCINTLKKHLNLKTAVWKDERCASMRFIARSLIRLNKLDEAYSWLIKACIEAPRLREPFLELAELELMQKNFHGAMYFSKKALDITCRSKTYINEAESWGAKPYDICAVALYYLGLYDKALDYGKKALEIEPNNSRLIENMNFYIKLGLK